MPSSLYENRFESILSAIDEGITVQDRSSRLVYANTAACRLLGFGSADELLSTPVADVLGRFEVFDEHGDPFSFANLPGRGVLQGERPGEVLLRFRVRGQPGERWSVVRAVPIQGQQGQIDFAVNLFRDVTLKRAQEEELRVSQEWLSTTLHSIGDAVIATDAQGRVQFINPAAEELTGWASAEAVGRSLPEVFPILSEQTRKPVESPVERAIRENKVVGLANHTILLRRDGIELSIDDSAAPIRNAQGTLVGVVLVFRDVTERRREELRREYLARATEELSSTLDYHQTLTTVSRLAVPTIADWCAVDILENGELCRLAVAHIDEAKVQLVRDIQQRYPPAQNSGTWRILQTGQPEWLADIPDSLLEASAQDAEHLALIRQLGLRSYIGVPLMREGQAVGVLSFATAESGRRHGPEDLALALALSERASVALEKAWLFGEQLAAREMLEQASRTKDEFLAILGHELRNPLGPIVTALQLVKARGVQGIEREQAVIERQVRHLTRLVDDLLDLARITRGQLLLHRQQVDLSDIAAQAAELASPLFERRQHELDLHVPQGAWVHGDPVRLVQIVSNLLNNAALYSEPRRHVELHLSRGPDEAWQLTVRDQGLGISPEMLERIFEPFVQQQQGPERGRGGLGLGLAIARRLAEMHEGTLVASSPGPGLGSTFTLALPAAQELQTANPSAEQLSPSTRPLDVLVVDDNDDARELMALALESEGHRVVRAHDGPSALAALEQQLPQLAILDIGLPLMDGYELSQRLRDDPRLASLKLIALTGYGQDKDRQRALQAGFDEHLVKPVSLDLLLPLLQRLTS